MRSLTGSVVIPFGTDSSSSGISLEEDPRVFFQPTTKFRASGMNPEVTVQDKRYIRLYVDSSDFAYTSIRVLTGWVVAAGQGQDDNLHEFIAFTPDSQIQQLAPGVRNVFIEVIGSAFTKSGTSIAVAFTYDAGRNQLKCSRPAFAHCKISYSRWYARYTYTFSGACPSKLSNSQSDDYKEGVVYATMQRPNEDMRVASLIMDAPRCTYGSIGVNFNDTASDMKLPTLTIEIDPTWQPALIKSSGSTLLEAQCRLRVYGAGETPSDMRTSTGVLTPGNLDSEYVEDILNFNNSVSQSLSRNPSSSVGLSVLHYASGASSFAGPGDTVVDVTWLPTDPYAYTNPRSRKVGKTEVVAVDMTIAKRSYAIVKAGYTASFLTYNLKFEYDSSAGQFKQALVYAKMADGRAATLIVNPPRLDSIANVR